jgi:hypothetical protein
MSLGPVCHAARELAISAVNRALPGKGEKAMSTHEHPIAMPVRSAGAGSSRMTCAKAVALESVRTARDALFAYAMTGSEPCHHRRAASGDAAALHLPCPCINAHPKRSRPHRFWVYTAGHETPRADRSSFRSLEAYAEMLPVLLHSSTQKLLVWGEDASFQTVGFAEHYAREIPEAMLFRIKSAGDIPIENDPKAVARNPADFFAAKQ